MHKLRLIRVADIVMGKLRVRRSLHRTPSLLFRLSFRAGSPAAAERVGDRLLARGHPGCALTVRRLTLTRPGLPGCGVTDRGSTAAPGHRVRVVTHVRDFSAVVNSIVRGKIWESGMMRGPAVLGVTRLYFATWIVRRGRLRGWFAWRRDGMPRGFRPRRAC